MTKFIKEADVPKLVPPLPIGKAELRQARLQGKIRFTPGQRTHWYRYDDLLDYIQRKTEEPKCQENGNIEAIGSTTMLPETEFSTPIGMKENTAELDERELRAARALRQKILKKPETGLSNMS